jgi:hypothetical protein
MRKHVFETDSVLRKKAVDDRQKDQLKLLKKVNKELLQRLTQETNLSFGTVQLILKKICIFFSIVCLLCMKLPLDNKSPHNHCHLELQALSKTVCDVTRQAKRQNLTFVYIFRKYQIRCFNHSYGKL